MPKFNNSNATFWVIFKHCVPCCTLPTKLHKINYTIDSESIDPDPLSGHVSKNRVNKVLKSHSKQQMHTRMQNGICWCSSSASSKPGQRAGCTICNSLQSPFVGRFVVKEKKVIDFLVFSSVVGCIARRIRFQVQCPLKLSFFLVFENYPKMSHFHAKNHIHSICIL